jgi:CheY-like chemotaxis protein
MTSLGLLLSDDLIFTSRIIGTARYLGLEVQPARTLGELLCLLESRRPTCVILDLHHADLGTADVVAACKRAGTRVVGYGAHVAVEVLKAAREAGCDVVWPRSKFVEELAAALPAWLQERK